MEDNLPNLIRTSSLDPEFIRNNLSLVNTLVKLLFERDTKEMMENWTEEEVIEQRRLVKFEFVRLSASDYLVKFKPIPKSEFTNNAAIISCIFWKEKELHIVTSVDIILLLEYLIQQSFSIEEKNRIRRNLQSLKPLTISRSNKNYSRFFQLLMSMEDPRPRNIEKDLKVFRWTDLFNALNKVISKYSSNHIIPANQQSQHSLLLLHTQHQIQPQSTTNQPQISPYYQYPQVPHYTQDSNGFSISLSQDGKSIIGSIDKISDISHNTEGFLPYERLKVMKKKQSGHQQAHYQNSSLNQKHKAYQNGIVPADPVPMDIVIDTKEKADEDISKLTNKSLKDTTKFTNGSSSDNKSKSDTFVNGIRNQTLMYPSESSSTSEESGGGYVVTSSDEQSEDKKSLSQTVSDEQSEKVDPKSGTSIANNQADPSYSIASKSVVVPNANTGNNGSGGSNRTNSGADSIFTKPKTSNTGISSVESEQNNTFHNINMFAQDQRNRIFGLAQQKEQPYYQYPDSSQIQYSPPLKPQLPPISSISSSSSSLNSKGIASLQLGVRLPSLEEYFSSSNPKTKSVQLPLLIKKNEKNKE